MYKPSRGTFRAVTLGCFIAVLAAAAHAERQIPQTQTDVFLSFSPVVKKAQPAVVNVYASRIDKRPRNPIFDDPVFRHFFGEGGQWTARRTDLAFTRLRRARRCLGARRHQLSCHRGHDGCEGRACR